MKKRNIFGDGDIVRTVVMPEKIFKGKPWEKEEWAKRVLGDFVSEFHGRDARHQVVSHLTKDNRVSGTEATFFKKGKDIVYMLQEPKPENQPGPDGRYRVHIVKAVYDEAKEASTIDMMEYKEKAGSFSCGLFEAARPKL